MSEKIHSLKPREKKFVEFFVQTGKRGESAIQAGYSKKCASTQACRLLKKTKIVNAVNKKRHELSEQVAEETKTSAKWVINELKRNHEIATCQRPVLCSVKQKDGSFLESEMLVSPNLVASNRALELIGKFHGLFVDDKSGTRSELSILEVLKLDGNHKALKNE